MPRAQMFIITGVIVTLMGVALMIPGSKSSDSSLYGPEKGGIGQETISLPAGGILISCYNGESLVVYGIKKGASIKTIKVGSSQTLGSVPLPQECPTVYITKPASMGATMICHDVLFTLTDDNRTWMEGTAIYTTSPEVVAVKMPTGATYVTDDPAQFEQRGGVIVE